MSDASTDLETVIERATPIEPIRLAFRDEGRTIACYIANTGTMNDAVLISSVPRVIFEKHKPIFTRWIEFMTECFKVMCTDVMGKSIVGFVEKNVPEIEKGGHS